VFVLPPDGNVLPLPQSNEPVLVSSPDEFVSHHQLLDDVVDDEVLLPNPLDIKLFIFVKNSSSTSVANFLFFKSSIQDTK
jgi:hypothetical protein